MRIICRDINEFKQILNFFKNQISERDWVQLYSDKVFERILSENMNPMLMIWNDHTSWCFDRCNKCDWAQLGSQRCDSLKIEMATKYIGREVKLERILKNNCKNV